MTLVLESELKGMPLQNQIRRIVWASQGGIKFQELVCALIGLHQDIDNFAGLVELTVRSMKDVRVLDYNWIKLGGAHTAKIFVYTL